MGGAGALDMPDDTEEHGAGQCNVVDVESQSRSIFCSFIYYRTRNHREWNSAVDEKAIEWR